MVPEAEHDILYPLSMFRMARQIPALSFDVIEGTEVPQPYHDLLVHDGDMTSRLEQFHGGSLYLDKLHSSSDGRGYFREVALRRQEDQFPVEYGAIEIRLVVLPADAAEQVLEAKRPLGGILNNFRISYSSSPKAFLKIVPDDAIRDIFGPVEEALFGRCKEIIGFNGES
ncbi:MAG: hypothetical protein VCA36_12345, partial [Opitutales bacterium]